MPNQATSQLIWNITYLALNITYTFIDEFVTISYSCAEERPVVQKHLCILRNLNYRHCLKIAKNAKSIPLGAYLY